MATSNDLLIKQRSIIEFLAAEESTTSSQCIAFFPNQNTTQRSLASCCKGIVKKALTLVTLDLHIRLVYPNPMREAGS
ncbi:hypothetical protein PoB_000952900 [Plakobranchus ocellatus]|uniref:Uncharacterized protein n=1 Tax=Plakobranchus ocellatus TaxID=259542 RepID=A0AAV3YJ34_9GAST|nr:hypothetical protein PoB_000952900 [Plakobranchus ocellatus]